MWSIDICKLRPDANKEFDCYGNEYRLFGHYVRCLQEFTYYCQNNRCAQFNVLIDWASEIFFEKHPDKSVRYLNVQCNECEQFLLVRFTLKPLWLLIEAKYN